MRDLLLNEGIDGGLRRAFVVYVLSHNRPLAELLAPARRPLSEEFIRGFEGRTATPVTVEELESTRETMIAAIVAEMPDEHRRFLLSFERGEPDWTLLGLPQARQLPAIRWRQMNLDTLTPDVRKGLIERLEAVLAIPQKRRAGS